MEIVSVWEEDDQVLEADGRDGYTAVCMHLQPSYEEVSRIPILQIRK